MSETRTDKFGKILSFSAPWLILGGGVVVFIYALFSYLDAGLRGAEDTYKYWVGEIAQELKDWYSANKAAGINGLTEDQQALLNIKKGYLQQAYNTYLEALQSRNLPVNSYVWAVIAAAIAAPLLYLAKKVGVSYLKERLDSGPPAPPAQLSDYPAGNTLAQIDLLTHAVAYDFAFAGDISTAAMIETTLADSYMIDYLPALEAQVAEFSTALSFLIPGTVQFIAMSNMLLSAQTIIAQSIIPTINVQFQTLPII